MTEAKEYPQVRFQESRLHKEGTLGIWPALLHFRLARASAPRTTTPHPASAQASPSTHRLNTGFPTPLISRCKISPPSKGELLVVLFLLPKSRVELSTARMLMTWNTILDACQHLNFLFPLEGRQVESSISHFTDEKNEAQRAKVIQSWYSHFYSCTFPYKGFPTSTQSLIQIAKWGADDSTKGENQLKQEENTD